MVQASLKTPAPAPLRVRFSSNAKCGRTWDNGISLHRWDNVVADKVRFKAELYQHIDKTRFQTLIGAMRTPRNKFIAHLDDQNKEYTPHMDLAKDAVQFYHSYIARNEAEPNDLIGLPTDLNNYYSACYREAENIYAS